jgi:tetrahydromethanopterin S-methyltransferase subunit G
MENFDELQKKLDIWNKKVNNIATEKYKKMMKIVGL